MDTETVEHLQELQTQYPYFHTVRVLLLQALYKQHSAQFDSELKKNAVLIPDRESLFNLIELPHYRLKQEKRKYKTDDQEDRTATLITNFLNEISEHKQETEPQSVDATQDYMSYLLLQEKDSHENEIPLNGGGAIEDFLENVQDGRKLDLSQTPESEPQNEAAAPQTNPNKEIFTEIMAGIYIKQGKYENAIKIIRQLSLKYPGKNRYFADQIRFLDKLIINNKNKKT